MLLEHCLPSLRSGPCNTSCRGCQIQPSLALQSPSRLLSPLAPTHITPPAKSTQIPKGSKAISPAPGSPRSPSLFQSCTPFVGQVGSGTPREALICPRALPAGTGHNGKASEGSKFGGASSDPQACDLKKSLMSLGHCRLAQAHRPPLLSLPH